MKEASISPIGPLEQIFHCALCWERLHQLFQTVHSGVEVINDRPNHWFLPVRKYQRSYYFEVLSIGCQNIGLVVVGSTVIEINKASSRNCSCNCAIFAVNKGKYQDIVKIKLTTTGRSSCPKETVVHFVWSNKRTDFSKVMHPLVRLVKQIMDSQSQKYVNSPP